MAILNNYLKPIADAIREKTGKVGFINAQNFASEIENMEPKYDTLEITKNGIFDVKDYKNAEVIVPSNDFETIKKCLERQYDANNTEPFSIPYGIEILGKYSCGEYMVSNGISMPTTINLICAYAFDYSYTFNIYYQGTSDDWLKIEKGYKYNRASDTDILMNGKYRLYINNTLIEDLVLSNSEVAYHSLANINLKNLYVGNVDVVGNQPYNRKNLTYFCRKATINNVVVDFYNDTDSFYDLMFQGANIGTLTYGEGHTTIRPDDSYGKITTLITPTSVTNFNISSSTTIGTIIMNATTPPTLPSSVSTSKITKVWVPKGTADVYKAATNWARIASIIFSKLTVFFNVDASLINNANVTYSIDDGALQQFTESSFQKDDIYKLVISNTDANTTILVGTTQGGSDLATISNATTTINISTDTNIYITKQ